MFTVDNSDELDITVAAKGGGSENKSKFAVLNPSDSVYDWVMANVREMGAGWCPPGILGIGNWWKSRKSNVFSKRVFNGSCWYSWIKARGPQNAIRRIKIKTYMKILIKLELVLKVLGGLTTVVDVKILDYPCHAASLPVAMIPNCAATRHIHFKLKDGKV